MAWTHEERAEIARALAFLEGIQWDDRASLIERVGRCRGLLQALLDLNPVPGAERSRDLSAPETPLGKVPRGWK